MRVKKWLVGLLIGIISGFLASGGGVVAVYVLKKMGVEQKKAHACAIAIILPACIISAVIYSIKGAYNIPVTIKTSIGGILGGALGGLCLKKIPDKYLKIIFGLIMIISAVKMWK